MYVVEHDFKKHHFCGHPVTKNSLELQLRERSS